MTNTTANEAVYGEKDVAVRDLERALNNAIIAFGHDNIQLRVLLMKTRRSVREALLAENS